jgi:hypothetical protein
VFYEWLLSQRERRDDVGGFALIAASDKKFPRQSHRLYILLRHCGDNPMLRRICKKAHAEFRAVRRAAAEESVVSYLDGGGK